MSEQQLAAEAPRGDLRSIAEFLGNKPFFMGEAASGIDATAYGFLANIVRVPIESPLKQEALDRPNIVEYVQRMEARYFEGNHLK